MKKKIICTVIAAVFAFALAGCGSSDNNDGKIDELNNRITEMQQEIDSLKNNNVTQTINELNSKIAMLNSTIQALQNENGNLQSDIDQLDTDLQQKYSDLVDELNATKARVTALEAAIATEPVVCNFGDTYTLKNNGIELFSIKFIYYNNIYDGQEVTNHLQIEFTNISMPYTKVNNYLTAYAFNEDTNTFYKPNFTLNPVQVNQTQPLSLMFNGYPSKEEITFVYLGIPNHLQEFLIPYIKLNMNNSEI